MKVPQEGCIFPPGQGETVRMLSSSSDSGSCSEVESSSEEVAMQLASLKERVGITHWFCR